MEHLVISVSRQSGSGGQEVAQKLARRLKIEYLGKEELMELAKGRSDYEEVQNFYEEQPVNSLLFAIAMNNEEEEMGRVPFEQIRNLCGERSCVILGRCTDYIFKDDADCVRIFLHGPEQMRAERTARLMGTDVKKARIYNWQTDEDRSAFYSYYTHRTWAMASNYDLCLDSQILGVDKTVEVILTYLKSRNKI